MDIDVVKYSSTARSRSSRPDTATILPLSLQENVRSPLSVKIRNNIGCIMLPSIGRFIYLTLIMVMPVGLTGDNGKTAAGAVTHNLTDGPFQALSLF
ncbi:MAG: hypothetical protein U0L14_07935 [Bifidobacterium ruminantium]|nr:hypothetical protein [Bifidobacterium ruminantium]